MISQEILNNLMTFNFSFFVLTVKEVCLIVLIIYFIDTIFIVRIEKYLIVIISRYKFRNSNLLRPIIPSPIDI